MHFFWVQQISVFHMLTLISFNARSLYFELKKSQFQMFQMQGKDF